MSLNEKLAIIILLNVITLLILITKLVKEGSSVLKALKLTWDYIIVNLERSRMLNQRTKEKLFFVQHYCWWLMLLLVVSHWVFIPCASPIFIIIMGFMHTIWAMAVYIKKMIPQNYNKIVNLNENWGIIFQDIIANSWFNQKSLAELDLRKKSLLVLAIERQGKIVSFPKGVEVLKSGDKIVIFGDLNYYKGMIEDLDISCNNDYN